MKNNTDVQAPENIENISGQMPRDVAQVEEVQEKFYLRPKELFAFTVNTTAARGIESYSTGNLNFFQSSVVGLTSDELKTKALVTSIWDAADDPISGFIIDRMRTRWGRLKPFLTLPVLLGDICTALIFFKPAALTGSSYFLYVMALTILNSICASFAGGGNLLLYNITPSTVERTQLISVSKFFGEIGKWPVSIVKFLVSYLPGLSNNRINQRQIYSIAILILSGIQMIGTLYYFFNVKERVPMPTKQQNKDNGIWKNVKLVFGRNLPMYILLLSSFLGNVKNIAVANEDNFWLHCTGKLSNGVISGLFTGIPKFILIPLAPGIVKRFGAKKTAVASGVFSGASYALLYLVGYAPTGNPILNLVWIVFMLTMAGIPNSIIDICNQLMTGDMYDYFEWKEGFRSEGLISSAMAYVSKFSGTLINWLSAAVLGWINYAPKYDSYKNVIRNDNPKIQRGFFGVFALAPAIARMGYGLACLLFPIHGEKKARMLNELDAARREKTENTESLRLPDSEDKADE